MLKEVLSYPEPATDSLDETLRRCRISRKLERLAIEAQDLIATLPALPMAQWFDGTFENAAADVPFVKCDLARLLQFLTNFGVCEKG